VSIGVIHGVEIPKIEEGVQGEENAEHPDNKKQ
jgi:hypothetical protein